MTAHSQRQLATRARNDAILTVRHRTRCRAVAGMLLMATAASISACGVSTPQTPAPATSTGPNAPTASGQQLFTSAGCASCHTLAAAHATGSVGPNLDQLKPSYAAVARQVTHGGGGMPSFTRQLSKFQIDAVARYVATATRSGN